MSKFKNTEGGWWQPLGWFVLILAGFWVVWYFAGGPQRPDVNQGPFLHPDQPIDSGTGYGNIGH